MEGGGDRKILSKLSDKRRGGGGGGYQFESG